MKIILFRGFSILILLGSIVTSLQANTLSSFERKLSLEKEMKQQIENDLELLVDKKWYKVNAIINLAKTRQLQSQEVLGSNSQEKQNSKIKIEEPQEVLPGFDALPEETDVGKTQNPTVSQNQQSATYEYVDDIKALTLNVILNEAIPQDQEALIQNYLEMRWVQPNAGLVTVSTFKKQFPQPPKPEITPPAPKPTPWQKFENFASQNAALLLIGFFLIIITIIIMLSGLKGQTDISIENKSLQDNASKPVFHENLLQELFAEPLLGRSYLQTLKREDQRKLLHFFQTSSLLPLMKQWLHIPAHVTLPEIADNDLDPQKVLAEFKAFKKIRYAQQEAPFGYLLDLDSEELFQLLEEESLATMAPILAYLPPQHLQGILSHLNQSDQEQLIQQVQNHVFSSPVVMTIDQRLRERFAKQSHLLMNPKQSPVSVIKNMLEQSVHGSDLAKKLIASNPTLQNTYARYVVEFDDLFTWKAEKIKKLLDATSNETLAQVLQPASIRDVEKRICILSQLSKERSKIIEGLIKSHASTLSPESIARARRELVLLMRNQEAQEPPATDTLSKDEVRSV